MIFEEAEQNNLNRLEIFCFLSRSGLSASISAPEPADDQTGTDSDRDHADRRETEEGDRRRPERRRYEQHCIRKIEQNLFLSKQLLTTCRRYRIKNYNINQTEE